MAEAKSKRLELEIPALVSQNRIYGLMLGAHLLEVMGGTANWPAGMTDKEKETVQSVMYMANKLLLDNADMLEELTRVAELMTASRIKP